MSNVTPAAARIERTIEKYRVALGVAGVAAVIAGLFILLWPQAVVSIVTIIVASYAIVAGIIYLGVGLFSQVLGTWSKIGRIAAGAVFVIVGVVALVHLATTNQIAVLLIGILVGLMWLVEGAVTLTLLVNNKDANGWTIAYAIIAIIAGVLVMLSPMWGFEVLKWMFGASFIALGIAQLIRAIRLGHGRATVQETIELD